MLLGFAALLIAQTVRADDNHAKADHTPSPQWDMIAFEMNSWGQPIRSWRILANGGGSWTVAEREESAPPFSAPSLVWHDIEPEAANYAALEKILAALPDTAPDADACANFMTDMPYGTLRLTRGATTIEIAWYAGCLEEGYVAFMDILKAADVHMEALGKAAPVSRTEAPGSG